MTKVEGSELVIHDATIVSPEVTPARLGLGRVGSSMPTQAVLKFTVDHARARDAVHIALDFDALEQSCSAFGLGFERLESAAPNRQVYLRRPDLGRRLSERSRELILSRPITPADVVIVVGDGLSSTAVQHGTAALLTNLVPRLRAMQLSLGPLVLASQARVALADEIGEVLGARMVIMLVGERPGLSASDSLGAYMTLGPKVGRTDADRNCVSNIRPGGLEPAAAAGTLAWLVENAFRLGASGVQLKDESTTGRAALPSS